MKQTLIVVILLNGPVKRLAKVLGALAALAVLVDLPAAAGVNPQWDAGAAAAAKRPRVVISTDFPPLDVIPVKAARKSDPPEKCSDPDDVQSMVRFLLYANEFDVEGLVASAGTFANVARKQNILDILNLYAKVYENLRRHDPRYPAPDKLRSVTWQGRDGSWGTAKVGTTAKPLDQILARTARHRMPLSTWWAALIPGQYGFVSGAVPARWRKPSGRCGQRAALPSWTFFSASSAFT
jgi:hypothetical protein